MRTKNNAIVVALVAAVTFFETSESFAYDTTAGSLEVGAFGGYTILDEFSGENPKDHFLYGGRFGVFFTDKVSFESSYQFTKTDTDRSPAISQDKVSFQHLRFNLLYHFNHASNVVPFVTGGLGWMRTKVENTWNSDDLGVNVGLGLKLMVTNAFAIRLDGRYLYAEVVDSREHNYEGMFGVSYLFGRKAFRDADADGVRDQDDTCASTPAGAKVDAKGCPTDEDSDGVYDGLDKCEHSPAGAKVDAQGCPTDGDGDGIFDGIDACPETPKNTPVGANGCVEDQDKDGVANSLDKCPATPEGVSVDEAGCPKDSDGDAVNDDIDLCPNTPGGTKVDEKGCPLTTKSRGVLKGVNFKSGSDELTPESLDILRPVATELKEFPKVRVEVQGHTDATGKAASNLSLSQKRAESVKRFLVQEGIPEDRLEAKGYGQSMPVETNKTASGRKANRRVELKWLD